MNEEGMKARRRIKWTEPSKKEIEEHMATHIPFREWCPHCVKGKSASRHHKRRSEIESESRMPTVSIDYMFMEDGKAELGMPILVMRDSETRMIQAYVVPQKGVDGYAVKRLSKDIDLLGHKRMIFKSDNEPALVA